MRTAVTVLTARISTGGACQGGFCDTLAPAVGGPARTLALKRTGIDPTGIEDVCPGAAGLPEVV